MTVTFQLTVEGEPPADATFFGYLGYEPAPYSSPTPTATASTPGARHMIWCPPETRSQL